MNNLKPRQIDFLKALKSGGYTSPVSRQELATVCESTGLYACPPSWITQDSGRFVERGLYTVPELDSVSAPKETVATAAPVQCSVNPVVEQVAQTPQGAVAVAPPQINTASLIMGMTGGERDNLIPSKFSGYVTWGHFKDVESVVRSRQFYPIFVTGLSGNGKTLMVEQVCAKLKRECYRVNITKQTDEDDLLGGFRLINGSTMWQDGPVVSAMKNGGVLLLDEVDLASHNIMCLQPVLEGKGVFLKKIGQWITPAEGFTVFATANTKGKGSDDGRFIGTGVMNEAFLDRFPITMEQPYATPATEKKILVKAGCEKDFAHHLTKWAEIIRKSFYEGAVDEIISTRRLVDIVNAFGIFNDKNKAIAFCLARFDDDTKEAFLNLYSKVDADMQMGDEEDSPATASPQGNECPF
jgi:cobaltochelatase CobS